MSQPLTKQAAIERLEAYQERLETALKKDPRAHDEPFDEAPEGVGLHEIDLAKTSVTMLLVERHLRDASGEIVGIRTALTSIGA